MSIVDDKFWAKVNKTSTCWLWIGSHVPNGYGNVRRYGKMVLAHRVAYELCIGSIPDGMEVDHTCHVRDCVNPDHLQLSTHKQNMENQSGAHSNSRSGVRGVSWYGGNKWRATVGHNGKVIHIGLYSSIAEAEKAVIAKRNELFSNNLIDRKENASA